MYDGLLYDGMWLDEKRAWAECAVGEDGELACTGQASLVGFHRYSMEKFCIGATDEELEYNWHGFY